MSEKYVVIELQKNGDTMGNIVTAHDTLEDAEYKFHTVAAAAAISTIEKHAVALLNDDGFPVERTHFEHRAEE